MAATKRPAIVYLLPSANNLAVMAAINLTEADRTLWCDRRPFLLGEDHPHRTERDGIAGTQQQLHISAPTGLAVIVLFLTYFQCKIYMSIIFLYLYRSFSYQ